MRAVYKCRLCGETYTNGCNASATVAANCMLYLLIDRVNPDTPAPLKIDTHYCGGNFSGSLGLADFQGWQKEEGDYETKEP